MNTFKFQESVITPGFLESASLQHFPAEMFPTIHPIHWLTSHFAVGGWSPLQRLSGMLTAHMTQIAPHNGFTWHPHRALEIYTWVLEGELYHEDTTGGRGVIKAGELQRMFAGDYIEHQELNLSGQPARVIQIWYVADRRYQGLQPHYEQIGRDNLPARQAGDATVYSLIGDDSPVDQHMMGRLTAVNVNDGGITTLEAPHEQEDLFLYVTDGTGQLIANGQSRPLKQYDVIVARPDAATAIIQGNQSLRFLNFYLPPFLTA